MSNTYKVIITILIILVIWFIYYHYEKFNEDKGKIAQQKPTQVHLEQPIQKNENLNLIVEQNPDLKLLFNNLSKTITGRDLF